MSLTSLTTTLATSSVDGVSYLSIRFPSTPRRIQPFHVVLVADISASMSSYLCDTEQTLQSSLRILFETLIANRGGEVTVDLISFSSLATLIYADITTLSIDERLKKFDRALQSMGPCDSTCFDLAFDLAFELRRLEKTMPGFLVFLTDGTPTIGLDREDLEDHVRTTRPPWTSIYTLGIGDSISPRHLSRLGEFAVIKDKASIPYRLGEVCWRIDHCMAQRARVMVDGFEHPIPIGCVFPGLHFELAFRRSVSSATVVFSDLANFYGSPEVEVESSMLIASNPISLSLPGLEDVFRSTDSLQRAARALSPDPDDDDLAETLDADAFSTFSATQTADTLLAGHQFSHRLAHLFVEPSQDAIREGHAGEDS